MLEFSHILMKTALPTKLKASTLQILDALRPSLSTSTVVKRHDIHKLTIELGLSTRDYVPLLKRPVKRGFYDLAEFVGETPASVEPVESSRAPKAAVAKPVSRVVNMTTSISSVSSDEVYVPDTDPTFVPWGSHGDIKKIVRSNMFFPVYIAGYSGNGKTIMVEQICASCKREYVRVQITPESDEDDLVGGFRLIGGETVFAKGPVIKAMEAGAILLIDELDRATNKIMCLQGVLEGKPVLIKKTGEVIRPRPGFNVIATANTKGRGTDDGRYVAAQIIDDAFLERFAIAIDQPFPTRAIEMKIVERHMEKFDCVDQDFADKLTIWAEVIRRTFSDGGVDEVISTRRLCHITQTYSIFRDRVKAISLCIARFDAETTEAFTDLYTKIDAGQLTVDPPPANTAPTNPAPDKPPF